MNAKVVNNTIFLGYTGVIVGITHWLTTDAMRKEAIAREDARENKAVKEHISLQYATIHNLERIARNVCKKTTASPCADAADYIKFAELYARASATRRKTVKPSWGWAPMLSKADLESVDAYREAFNSFYCNMYPFGNNQQQPSFPASGEFESFLTFHWTVTMANTICAEKGELWGKYKNLQHQDVYNRALSKLQEDNKAAYERVISLHNQVRPSLLSTRNKVFRGSEDRTGISE